MSAIIIVLGMIAAIAAWWLMQQGLASKPWLETGVAADARIRDDHPLPAAKMGLRVFLAVAVTLFALFVSAYSMRMQMPDWWALPVPRLLYVNTGILVLSSLTLHWAKLALARGRLDDVRTALLATGASTLAFLIGQGLAWRQLVEAGYFLAGNPANSFFYLITGAHALHVLGGLVGLGRVIGKARRAATASELTLGVDLCATYWHFLLLAWLILFSVLTGWAGDFVVMCRRLLT
jgi:cytochrome c oxidase subunit III